MSTQSQATVQRLLDVHDVAEQLGVSVSTIYRWRSTGEHPTPRAIKIGTHVRWRQSAVDEFIDGLAEAA